MKNDIKKIEETEKVKNWDLIFETKKKHVCNFQQFETKRSFAKINFKG